MTTTPSMTLPSPGIAANGDGWMVNANARHVHGMPAAWPSAEAPAVVALTDGAAIALDASLGNAYTVTLAGNRTLSNPSNPSNGQVIQVYVTQDGTGSRTLAYDTAYDWGAAGAPTLTTTAAKTDLLEFVYNAAAAKWFGLRAIKGF